MADGDRLVGTAVPAPLELEVPPAPTLAEAEDARHRYPCYTGHVFPTCFVCGPGRPEGDGLGLYPGPVRDWGLLACPWRPRSDLLDGAELIRYGAKTIPIGGLYAQPKLYVDGAMLIGVDLQKDPAVIHAAYNDSAGVTAQFNLNMLRHLNRIFGSDLAS